MDLRLSFQPLIKATILIVTLLTCLRATNADDLDNIIFEGIVRDTSGAVITAAQVLARNTATGVARAVVTDDAGRFKLVATEPGSYTITVAAQGFIKQETTPTHVAMGRRIALEFTLTPVGVVEQIDVSALNVSLIDTARTVVGDTISRDELEGLSLITRDPLELVFLLGGAVEAPLATSDLADEGRGRVLRGTPEEAGIFSLTGAPATSNNITIDGLDNNDDRAARERITLPPEAIAEVQVITNQYAAEYGRASGGRLNIRTRAGANNYRGEAYLFFTDESLNANTFFRNARGLGRIPQQQLREGIVYSGPVRKSKDFFFMNYERLDTSDFAEIAALVPVQNNPLFPLPRPNQPPDADSAVALLREEISTPEQKNTLNFRVDLNFTSSHNGAVRFDILRGDNKRGFPGVTRLPETILAQGRDSDSISFADNLVIAKNVINQTRFQFSRLLPRNGSIARSVGVVIQEPGRVVAGGFTGSNSSPAFAREEKRIQLQESFSLDVSDHRIKAGADLQVVQSNFIDLFATGGQYTFETVADFLANHPAHFIQRFNTSSRLSNTVSGLFIQDEWKITPSVLLSLGLRWDAESIIDDRDNISPRVAVAWNPFGGKNRARSSGSGLMLVRAGFGVFYNRALLRTLDDFSLGRSKIIIDSEITPRLLELARFPQPITSPEVIAQFGISETGFLRRKSPDLEIPYTIQTGLGLERQLSRNLVVTADYVFTRGAHLWRESNINAPVLPEGFASLTEFLLSRDFDNRPQANGLRPIASSNAEVIRFDLGANTSSTAGAVQVENGIRVLTLGLNAPRSSNINAALNAVRFLRPDPSLTQVEMLESTGNSFYHGGVFALRFMRNRHVSFRATYTISKLIDEGTTNTASPQDVLDRRTERALSLQDQRHRMSFSGLFQVPFIKLDLAPIISFGSSRPFNIGAGFDRNLNDIENDRPNFLANIERPVWRRPGSEIDSQTKTMLVLAPIGSGGNLPRNYGRGPGTRTINLRASRTFAPGERVKIRPSLDVFNLFNNAIFSFGSEFIDRDDTDFLAPRRTQRARTIQLSLKVSF